MTSKCDLLRSRDVRDAHRLTTELGPLIGRALVSASEPGPDALSQRLQQTLACLLDGDSEKQLAARLGLSRATIHQYVTALYRYFGVTSRAHLLALMIKRTRRDGWSRLSPGSEDGLVRDGALGEAAAFSRGGSPSRRG